MKKFVFLYPEQEIFDQQIDRDSVLVSDAWEAERGHLFKNSKSESRVDRMVRAKKDLSLYFGKIYARQLNLCIDHRYRNNGFEINYFLLDGESLSNIIDKKPTDKILFADMEAKTHRTKRSDGTFPYPDQDFMLDQVLPASHLRIAGFHMWDCVQLLAQRAHERGVDVLVDEDLTESFTYRMAEESFRPSHYIPKKLTGRGLEVRMGKPWLYPEYNLISQPS